MKYLNHKFIELVNHNLVNYKQKLKKDIKINNILEKYEFYKQKKLQIELETQLVQPMFFEIFDKERENMYISTEQMKNLLNQKQYFNFIFYLDNLILNDSDLEQERRLQKEFFMIVDYSNYLNYNNKILSLLFKDLEIYDNQISFLKFLKKELKQFLKSFAIYFV
ncbi:MAG: hypothetical protein KatS3mg129_1313 [Leptospiraceae bacterium]|nr:MAG: hypothetical protein KatS3mg129_1313 [Leptospiraceae bacterium]